MGFHGLIANFFSALYNIPLSGCSSLFIHSPGEGYLGYFHVLAIMTKATINIHVQVSV